MNNTPKQLQLIRKALRLPENEPNFSGFFFKPSEKKNYSTLEKLSEEEINSEKEAWRKEGFRGKLARKIYYNFKSPRFPLREKVIKPLVNKITEKKLSNSRVLNIKSHHINCTDTDTIEVYIDLGDNNRFFIDIYTIDAANEFIKNEFTYRRNKNKEMIIGKNDLGLFPEWCEWFIVDQKILTDNILEQAIKNWYIERYSYDYDHWTQFEADQLIININIEWQTPTEYNKY